MLVKNTSFDPIIISPKADDVIKVFEVLGFEKTHTPVTETETRDVPSVRMKNADGFHLDVAEVKDFPRDMMEIRMNVDNFEEAYGILTAHGFTNTRGDGILETGSAIVATMVSPSGFMIAIVKHNKK